jgi:hypothetical protein
MELKYVSGLVNFSWRQCITPGLRYQSGLGDDAKSLITSHHVLERRLTSESYPWLLQACGPDD